MVPMRESKGMPVFHIDFCKVALIASSERLVITELARKGEGGAHVPTC
jgi:hypothetical protein